MDSKIYRKKSIDRVKSPEELNDYIRVSNPSVWLVLSAIIILLIGICIWGIFGRLYTKISVNGICTNGILTCYVEESDIQKITDDMKITIDNKDYKIVSIENTAIKAGDVLKDEILYSDGVSKDRLVYEVIAKADLPNGAYRAEIIVESISPIYFVLN